MSTSLFARKTQVEIDWPKMEIVYRGTMPQVESTLAELENGSGPPVPLITKVNYADVSQSKNVHTVLSSVT